MKKSDIEKQLVKLSEHCRFNDVIDEELYIRYDVKRGLRDIMGKGVLAGLTDISEVCSSKIGENGESIPCEGELYYRGYNIKDIIHGFINDKRFGFEEVVYLLIFGDLPTREEEDEFTEILAHYRGLPKSFVRDIIMKAPPSDMMNTLARSVLALYSYDKNPNDISIPNVLRQCIQLIAQVPLLSVYGYQAHRYYNNDENFFIHTPRKELSTAENILYMLRPDGCYTPLEARVLDMALVLHAEHGGGNNSTFTTHVVTSSGTDTYSAIAASLGSLKGFRHGGANIKVVHMFDDIKKNVRDWNDDEELSAYLTAIINKEAFDRSGLIYGIGHAVYSVSDPRADVFRAYVEKLSEEKGMASEYALYRNVERLAPSVIAKKRKIYKGVSANVDFYSGFAYQMLGLPIELNTPIFAIARMAGWSAHRIEELVNEGKIIRPAYKSISERREYVPMSDREALTAVSK
ncbi:MAG: citrate/2-methylcitrate synthase [Eubacteriales bacterium]